MSFAIALSAPDDFEGWRDAAARLAAAGIPPEAVEWNAGDGADSLFGSAPSPLPDVPPQPIPESFRDLARFAICHADSQRFALLYRLLFRLTSAPGLLSNRADADVSRTHALAKNVSRDRHKMTAFVRFREVAREDQSPAFVSWFEPEHHILRLTAPFFVRRFASQVFSILTPKASAHWDGESLRFGPGASRRDAPDGDRFEALWLTYYASIFNPARLKVDMMKSEMPVKYWKNLPEAALIAPLIRDARARMQGMIAAPTASRAARGPGYLPQVEPAGGLTACRACPLHAMATQVVPGAGPENARMMIVGEQPGDREDLEGQPFVGPSGQLLDEALRRSEIDRSTIYLTNAVKHFHFEPRGKHRLHKTPTRAHVEACSPWLRAEIRRVEPEIILAMGATAARAVLKQEVAVKAMRGRVLSDFEGRKVLITWHPAALLRLTTREEKRAAWAEFLADLRLARDIAQIPLHLPFDGQAPEKPPEAAALSLSLQSDARRPQSPRHT
ncbi:MAG: UdgX family uracil-DNA binding protein [Beijerinckiaceae bacterium]|jgi:DNA polymerase|nr:UdgX family uracil-DNA binding protein [Beijerinckiaceae bacterium]